MKRERKLKLDDFIKDAETSLSFPIIVIIILLIVIFFTKFYLLSFFILLVLIVILEWLNAKNNIYKIKKFLVSNNLLDKIGDIYFWNEKDCILTDNYFILIVGAKVVIFKYEDIDSIYKKTNVRRSAIEEYLYICLKNGEEYQLLIWSTNVRSEKLMDISDYLVSKNKNIKVMD